MCTYYYPLGFCYLSSNLFLTLTLTLHFHFLKKKTVDVKLVVVGDGMVGKTHLIKSWATDEPFGHQPQYVSGARYGPSNQLFNLMSSAVPTFALQNVCRKLLLRL